jgi:hypothetical protein
VLGVADTCRQRMQTRRFVPRVVSPAGGDVMEWAVPLCGQGLSHFVGLRPLALQLLSGGDVRLRWTSGACALPGSGRAAVLDCGVLVWDLLPDSVGGR